MKYCSFDRTQRILIHSFIYKVSYGFIDYCLTFSEQYYSYCQLYKTYIEMREDCSTGTTTFDYYRESMGI